MTLETVDLPGVVILAAGGPYTGHGSASGGDYFTSDDLRGVAAASNALAGEIRAPVKLGHSREQRLLQASGIAVDEQPAAGWLADFRVEGGKLLADLKAVPRKLADLIKVGAFRTRSVELDGPVRSQRSGLLYGSVVTGLALLGAKAPAVRTLDDVVALYSAAFGADDDGTQPQPDEELYQPPLAVADPRFEAFAGGAVPVTEAMFANYAVACGVPAYRAAGWMRSVV